MACSQHLKRHPFFQIHKITKPVLWAVFLMVTGLSQALGQFHGTILDEETQEPIPFANIVFGDAQNGTISDLNGTFTIPESTADSLTISCVGYHSKSFLVNNANTSGLFHLSPKTIELQTVNVFPGVNPALEIMNKVVDHCPANNPDLCTNYSCILYHKMSFSLEVPDSAAPEDSLARKFMDFSKNNHLLLMESVSEKKHMMPDKNNERIISGRVSGLKDPDLAVLPSQIQPFGFYSRYIGLMDIQHLNPVSKAGLKHYFFILEDTIIENRDTLFYITFQPRKSSNIKPLSGSFHIHKKTYGIKNIRARSNLPSAPFEVEINQSYELIDEKQWFPAQLESKLVIHSMGNSNSLPYPMVGRAKSMVTAVNLEPDLKKRDFSAFVLEDHMRADTNDIKIRRYEPLTAKDSSTYYLLDSIGRANNLDNLVKLQKELIRGYLPAGPLLIDLKHLIGYNSFEGLKLGMGIWTGRELTGDFSVGGFFSHSFEAETNNYGGGIKWKPEAHSQTGISFSYSHALQPTGDFLFHQGNMMSVEDLLRTMAVATMDKQDRYYGSVEARFWGPLSGKLFFSQSDIEPVRLYNFIPDAEAPVAPFSNIEYGLKLRWAYKEKLSKTAFGVFPKSNTGPRLWFNIIAGLQESNGQSEYYTKLEAQVEKSFRTGPAAQTTLRFAGATIDGWNTPTNLYSFFGTFAPFSVEIPYMFATMGPNEFAADRFIVAFLNHKILLRQNKPGNFKPEINFVTRAGWGDIAADHQLSMKTFNQGFFESGILFDNLFKVLFIKYGLGVHYRYGPYQNADGIDNWSFRVALDFAF
ncbi:DUF5686 and carboxypeptidase-like regulatory domain-containing protein [Marinilabilia rubra]|uniref:Carboxypeptidase-like regulatory domain-containing protein n=1 Tax=Marinilabilia rubra TaxID=2162893 RepID=A0A2U2B393_9BACT|nr:DUF5686 and carboxypeptidase-like regulatory domain-containing protein [Marinilabilia rubra]PWD97528.1 hypothetical protein DDZ16_20290 [Marinilabilia rubra]